MYSSSALQHINYTLKFYITTLSIGMYKHA